jgi:hypothetical protein
MSHTIKYTLVALSKIGVLNGCDAQPVKLVPQAYLVNADELQLPDNPGVVFPTHWSLELE